MWFSPILFLLFVVPCTLFLLNLVYLGEFQKFVLEYENVNIKKSNDKAILLCIRASTIYCSMMYGYTLAFMHNGKSPELGVAGGINGEFLKHSLK